MVTNDTALPDAVFDALGHATRRDILRLLVESPRAVGEIAGQLPVTRPAVSKHLKSLMEAGLVRYEADGTRNVFSLDTTGFARARDALDGFWDVALQNFAHLMDRDRSHG